MLCEALFGVSRAGCYLTVWGTNALHCAAIFITEHIEDAVVGCAKDDGGLPSRVSPVSEQFVRRKDLRDMGDDPFVIKQHKPRKPLTVNRTDCKRRVSYKV